MTIFAAARETITANPGMTLDAYCANLDTSELGNSHRLQARFGDVLRFSTATRSWIAFDGAAWRRDADTIASGLSQRVALALKDELLESDPDPDAVKAFRKHSAFSQSARSIFATLKLSEAGLACDESDFDRAPHLINTPSATVDLTTGKGRPHDPADMLTGLSLADFDPYAPRPVFDQFIIDICRDADGNRDEAKEAYLKVALGYSLFAHNEKHLIFFITGDESDDKRNGRNGKSALFNAISAALGGDYVRRFESKMLCRSNGKAPDAVDRLPLIGARLAFSSELNAKDVVDTGVMKSITGEAEAFVRVYYANAKAMATTATAWIGTNYLPRFSSNEQAVWDRVRRIRFLNRFYDPKDGKPAGYAQEQDPTLGRKLEAERDGILAWLVEGAIEYATNGFPEYAEAIASLTAARVDNDPVGDFLESCVVVDGKGRVSAKELLTAFNNYATQNGLEQMEPKAFGNAVSAKRLESKKIGGVVYRIGARFNFVGRHYANGSEPEVLTSLVAVFEDGERVAAAELGAETINALPEEVWAGETHKDATGKVFVFAVQGDKPNVIRMKRAG